MTKFAYAISIASMSIVALFAGSNAAFAGEVATSASAPAVLVGHMLYGAGGKRLAAVYRLTTDGSPQIILDGKLVTVPVATVATENGKVSTSLSKAELTAR